MNEIIPELRQHLEERDWDKVPISNLAKSISIEAAELLELFQWKEMNAEQVLADPEKLDDLKKELADVLIYCLEIALQLNLDPVAIVRAKLEIAAKKYPVELVKSWQKNEQAGGKSYEAYKKNLRKQAKEGKDETASSV